jgi:hypothetical protein
MSALGGTVSEHAPANLPRSLLNFGLTLMAIGLMIVSAVMLLHAPSITVHDLVMFVPSAVLFLTPHLTNLIEAALGLSEFGSIAFELLIASLCTGLYAFNFHIMTPGIGKPPLSEVRSTMHTACRTMTPRAAPHERPGAILG